MKPENKVLLDAPILLEDRITDRAMEKASVLAFPDEKQSDLQYIRSIMVSTGTNKNGAHFLAGEILRAHNTVVNKAIDVEHKEDEVIGHIYDCAFLYKNGEQFDPKKVYAEYKESGRNVDELDLDIAVAGVIHKLRFPSVAEEINKGEWKVSMECYFENFDIKVGNQIITRQEAELLGYTAEQLASSFIKVVAGHRDLGTHSAARVLRNITFSGMGIVKRPANPRSIIMETANIRAQMEKNTTTIDLEAIDNMRGHIINIRSGTPESVALGRILEITTPENPDRVFVELDKDTRGISRVLSVNKESAKMPRISSGPGTNSGPGRIASWPDDICKSFKKRHTKFGGLDQSEGVVLHEHWCALFEEPCPVIGASSKAPECLRNAKNRTVKDERDNTLTTSIRDHLNNAPSNTYTQITTKTPETSAKLEEKKAQVIRIRESADVLKETLRNFVNQEKKKTFEVASGVTESVRVARNGKVVSKFSSKGDALKAAQEIEPNAIRSKENNFVLLKGSKLEMIDFGLDREKAVEKAASLVREEDTIIYLSKAISRVGQSVILKDQLMFYRIQGGK